MFTSQLPVKYKDVDKDKEKKEDKEKFPMCESIDHQSLWGPYPKRTKAWESKFLARILGSFRASKGWRAFDIWYEK